ncbi:PREDICTED: No exine formation 1 [Prunus dulcis]|uniref:PREDICTED: No exine formation 1 n=1 Tax=Prunus dulcis TaxID=3755 RepID=A0A5E4EK08_PRUDU|nr:PREDICTED: No exine formation 1 [Prunus dulcis]
MLDEKGEKGWGRWRGKREDNLVVREKRGTWKTVAEELGLINVEGDGKKQERRKKKRILIPRPLSNGSPNHRHPRNARIVVALFPCTAFLFDLVGSSVIATLGFMVSYIVDVLIFKYVAFFSVWLSLVFFSYFLLTTFTSFPSQSLLPSSLQRPISSSTSRSHSSLSGFKSRTFDHSSSPLRRLLPLHLGHQLPLAPTFVFGLKCHSIRNNNSSNLTEIGDFH